MSAQPKITTASNINTSHPQYWTRTEIIKEYLATKEGKTKRLYEKNLQRFFSYTDVKRLEKLGPRELLGYKEYLIEQKFKPNTINTYLAAVRDFISWCAEVGYLSYNPSINLKNVKQKDINEVSKARMLEDFELKALFKATSKGDLQSFTHRVMMLLMFNLGLRISEVMSIKIRDINLSSNKPCITILGKGSKLRVLGLNTVLQFELNALISLWGSSLKLDDYLIQSTYWKSGEKNTKPASTKHGREILNRYAKTAGLKPFKTHSARVTAINKLLDQDVEMRDVANFAGHSSIDTTRGYDRKSQDKVIATSNLIEIK